MKKQRPERRGSGLAGELFYAFFSRRDMSQTRTYKALDWLEAYAAERVNRFRGVGARALLRAHTVHARDQLDKMMPIELLNDPVSPEIARVLQIIRAAKDLQALDAQSAIITTSRMGNADSWAINFRARSSHSKQNNQVIFEPFQTQITTVDGFACTVYVHAIDVELCHGTQYGSSAHITVNDMYFFALNKEGMTFYNRGEGGSSPSNVTLQNSVISLLDFMQLSIHALNDYTRMFTETQQSS